VPIYEYRCEACAHELEKLQKMSEDELIDCPDCDQPALKRLVSAAAFRLKGSGWYETDFKKDNKRNLAESSSEDSSDKKSSSANNAKADKSSSGNGANKPDAKPAAKPAEKSSTGETKNA
jgi:putative FmdB family regulatory protein